MKFWLNFWKEIQKNSVSEKNTTEQKTPNQNKIGKTHGKKPPRKKKPTSFFFGGIFLEKLRETFLEKLRQTVTRKWCLIALERSS